MLSHASSSTSRPPRPQNSFFLYGNWQLEQLPPTERRNQRQLSTRISQMWKNETEEVKGQFGRLAEEAKLKHQQKYPGYKYQPRKEGPLDGDGTGKGKGKGGRNVNKGSTSTLQKIKVSKSMRGVNHASESGSQIHHHLPMGPHLDSLSSDPLPEALSEIGLASPPLSAASSPFPSPGPGSDLVVLAEREPLALISGLSTSRPQDNLCNLQFNVPADATADWRSHSFELTASGDIAGDLDIAAATIPSESMAPLSPSPLHGDPALGLTYEFMLELFENDDYTHFLESPAC